MAFKPTEVAEITVQGMRYRDWESVVVHLAEGESNNTFRFTCSEGKPLSKNWAEIRIKPGDHCTVKLAGQLAITGYVEKRQVAYTAEQHGIEIIGQSYTKALADGSAMTETSEFRKKSFEEIAKPLCKQAGLNFNALTPLNQKKFERACIPPGATVWQFLEPLARMRGITLGTDVMGNMTGRAFFFGGGDKLIEGVNILEGREEMSIAGGDGPNSTYAQQNSYDFRWGPKNAHGANSKSTNPALAKGKGVAAPNVQTAETSGDKEDTQIRSDNEGARRGQEQLQVTIVVQGWLKPSGGLWKPGQKVHVKSPMLIVDEPLDLVSVNFTQDNKSGTRTTLELKRDTGEGKDDKDKYDFTDKSKDASKLPADSPAQTDQTWPYAG